MPAKHERYLHRNEQIGKQRIYVCGKDLWRLEVDDKPVEDGTLATVVDAFDFDFPFMYELADGRRTRGGGSSWLREDGYWDCPVLYTPEMVEKRKLLFLQYLMAT